jgi:hypothetical protein
VLGYGAVAAALVGLTAVPPTAAEPADGEPAPAAGAETVGTAVQVLIHKSFTEITDADQCIGSSTLTAVRRGSSAILSEGSATSDTRKVAVGQFFRSRRKDGMCQVLYITSAPVMATFNVQFVGPRGELSPTFGPNPSEPVTDQPGIRQAVRIDMEFAPRP